MNTILMYGVPPAIEARKERNPAVHVDGASIVLSEIVQAVLNYCTADRLCFLCDSPHSVESTKEILASYPNGGRGEIILTDKLSTMTTTQRVAMQINTPHMAGLTHLRRALGHPSWPVLGMIHALSHQDYSSFALVALATLFARLSSYDALLCTTQAGRVAVENLCRGAIEALADDFGIEVPFHLRFEVIPLGVHAATFHTTEKAAARVELGIPRDRFVFLYFGRLAANTKMDLFPLILAMSRIVRSRCEREAPLPLLIIAGDDCETHTAPLIEQFALELGIAEQVQVRPNPGLNAKHHLYSAADVFVSPSDNVQETFGITIIEAMAAGLPVIASDWDGYRDTVVNGRTGFLIPTYWNSGIDYVSKLGMVRRDASTHWMLGQCVSVDLKSLQTHMEILIDNRELRESMGREAVHRVLAEYDWPVVIRKYEDLWNRLIDEAANHPSPNGPFRYSSATFDYVRAFGHYATRVLPLESPVMLTDTGHDYAQGKQKLPPLEVDRGLFRGDVSRYIARVAAGSGTVEWGALSTRVAEDLDLPLELARHHVARLMKYGLLELA